MRSPNFPITTDLVLIGGGHSHAIVLKLWGMNLLPGVRLTLITDTSHTPYSGMLPGHVAGFYSFDETHIDLRRLARFTKAQFYRDRAIGLDLVNNKIICANHPPVAFDYLSIDIGSTPATNSIPGACEYTIPAKPVPQFLQAWNTIIKSVRNNPTQKIDIGIVGGGAGGVELAFNIQSHLHRILKDARQPFDNLAIHLFHRDTKLLSGHNQWVSQRLQQLLIDRGIHLHLPEIVSEILPDKIICQSGLIIKCHPIFWVTQASAPSWIKQSGITTDAKGFILVKNTLQSVSHPHIFAAGDIATIQDYSRPKAGVFAVRQGKPLFENLQRIILGKKLKLYIPQKRYLSLIGTGDKNAIASWSLLGWQSSLLWRWKDNIDRKFMQRFEDLPQMKETEKNQTPMRCSGCGSKVGGTILEKVLQRLETIESKDVLIGLNSPDDAAVVRVRSNQLIIHTIDFFRSLIDDPFLFGQIATNHCLSDVFAMGATPQSALAVVTIPYSLEEKTEETLYQLLSGAIKVLKEVETPLVGGHTTEGAELAFGLSCNGLINPEQLLRKSGMKAEEKLILTKAIGTGTLFAADMKYRAKGRWIDNAVESMLLSNQIASKIFLEYGATACTDITGFGLLGHLVEMMKASCVGVELDLESIPVLEGAIATIKMGITSSLQPQNLQASNYISNISDVNSHPKYPLLFDPQTSGGLLASVPSENANDCLIELQKSGYKDSSIIGRVVRESQKVIIRECL
ncbi:MAG: selenide, water dikinase SelD [Hydrococcus sp. RU_2_2]|nr:selenide, water dikinase SelD [Hydrococcus sp. RU_2_2]NJP19363.1 selenide, water dikinase SelD [Hydrococcus sp. CRU_1_1]